MDHIPLVQSSMRFEYVQSINSVVLYGSSVAWYSQVIFCTDIVIRPCNNNLYRITAEIIKMPFLINANEVFIFCSKKNYISDEFLIPELNNFN